MFWYLKALSILVLMSALASFAAPEARAQIATNLKCKRCVGTGDLAKNAVAGNRLRNNTVTGKKIKDGTVALGDLSPAVQERIAKLEDQVTQLTALVQALQASPVFDLDPFVSVVDVRQDVGGVPTDLPTVRFDAVNVQIVNGTGHTLAQGPDDLNGLGNLIVGYNEPRAGVFVPVCSDGQFDNLTDCEAGGLVWALNHKSGSHNLVIGAENAYSQTNGVVFGFQNAVNRAAASVTGGRENIASGQFSTVSGGAVNEASGTTSSVSGGTINEASGTMSSVSGGAVNKASGVLSSVSGGADNAATGNTSSISGGFDNDASGERSSVSGGKSNQALAMWSTVSGGINFVADTTAQHLP